MSATQTEQHTGIPGSDGLATDASGSFVQRVYNIPLVNGTLNKTHAILNSNSYSAAAYSKVEQLSTSILKATEPLQTRLEPQLKLADGYANGALDFVEKKFPVVNSQPDELVKKVRGPADQAAGIAKGYADAAQSRISPVTEEFKARTQQTIETVNGLTERLSTSLKENVPGGLAEAYNNLKAELDSFAAYVAAQRKELPAHAQHSVQPVLDRFTEGYGHVKEEFSKPDVPMTQKATNILTYTREQAFPLLNDAVAAIKELVSKKKAEAEEKVNGATSS